MVRTLAFDAAPAGSRMPYVVVEQVDGRSFNDLWSDGHSLTSGTVAGLAAQAADGLAAIHAAGIVHSGLRADNIVLGDDGVVRIMDFAFAGSRHPEPDGTRFGPEPGPAAPANDVRELAEVITELMAGPPDFEDLLNGVADVPGAFRDRVLAAGASAELADLIGDMTAADAGTRPTAGEASVRFQAIAAHERQVEHVSQPAEQSVEHRQSTRSPGRAADTGLNVSNRFELSELLGSGGQGTVTRAYDRAGGRWVAVKAAHKVTDASRAGLAREAAMGLGVNHPNVVAMVTSDVTSGGSRTPYIVTEFVRGESLWEQLASGRWFTPAEAAELGVGIAQGVAAIHRAGVVHRDIKPGNIIIDRDGRPRIMDFALAVPVGQDAYQSGIGGTPGYMPIEKARSREGRPLPGIPLPWYEAVTADDSYSVAMLLSELVSGLRDADQRDADVSSSPEDPPFGRRALDAGASPEFADLLDAATVRDPARRLTVAEMADRLVAIAAHEHRIEGELFGEALAGAHRGDMELLAPAAPWIAAPGINSLATGALLGQEVGARPGARIAAQVAMPGAGRRAGRVVNRARAKQARPTPKPTPQVGAPERRGATGNRSDQGRAAVDSAVGRTGEAPSAGVAPHAPVLSPAAGAPPRLAALAAAGPAPIPGTAGPARRPRVVAQPREEGGAPRLGPVSPARGAVAGGAIGGRKPLAAAEQPDSGLRTSTDRGRSSGNGIGTSGSADGREV